MFEENWFNSCFWFFSCIHFSREFDNINFHYTWYLSQLNSSFTAVKKNKKKGDFAVSHHFLGQMNDIDTVTIGERLSSAIFQRKMQHIWRSKINISPIAIFCNNNRKNRVFCRLFNICMGSTPQPCRCSNNFVTIFLEKSMKNYDRVPLFWYVVFVR